MTNNIIEFPIEIEVASCYNCINHFEGPLGLFCGEFRESLVSDVAPECGAFEDFR